MNESKPIFAPGFEPTPYTEQKLKLMGVELGVKLTYGHRAEKFKMVQLRTTNNFVDYGRLSWFAKQHNLSPATIYSLHNEKDGAKMQFNFAFEWNSPFE